MKITLIDFDDSFTYNIVGELKQIGLSCEVVHWTELSLTHEFDLLILGPGPGHPHDYTPVFPVLREFLKSKKVLGICLGHQLIWNLQDALVTRSKEPVHGERIRLVLNSFWKNFFNAEELMVMRYNSLAVLEHSIISDAKLLSIDNEVMMSCQDRIVGLQFHPESLGTASRSNLFRQLIKHFAS